MNSPDLIVAKFNIHHSGSRGHITITRSPGFNPSQSKLLDILINKVSHTYTNRASVHNTELWTVSDPDPTVFLELPSQFGHYVFLYKHTQCMSRQLQNSARMQVAHITYVVRQTHLDESSFNSWNVYFFSTP